MDHGLHLGCLCFARVLHSYQAGWKCELLVYAEVQSLQCQLWFYKLWLYFLICDYIVESKINARKIKADTTLREKSSVICIGPCVTVAELACRSGWCRAPCVGLRWAFDAASYLDYILTRPNKYIYIIMYKSYVNTYCIPVRLYVCTAMCHSVLYSVSHYSVTCTM